MSDDNPNTPKKFGLRPIDANRLVIQKEHLDALFSIAVSSLVADRFSYPITERTQFRLAADLQSVEVWERPLGRTRRLRAEWHPDYRHSSPKSRV
jgi:hypothetical protein